MSLAAWEAFLTEAENDLDASEEAVRSGSTTTVPEWEAPTDLGDMPPALAGRVKNLIERIGVLATFVKYQLTAIDADIEHVHKQEQQKGTHNRAVALFLDASV
ncbi:MAG: hypothetical protein Q4G51_13000 [Dermatophilus congolensis]|nr:hypothetical protein [Dermatophilus congolensis]